METETEREEEGRKKGRNIIMRSFAFSEHREYKKIATVLPMIYINPKLKAICN